MASGSYKCGLVNMAHALSNPTCKEFHDHLEKLIADGVLRLLHKAGNAFARHADTRTQHTCHYQRNVFDPDGERGTDGALILACDLTDRQHSIALENKAIEVLSTYDLCANTKGKDSHNNYYSSADPGVVYAVPVVPTITTKDEFKVAYKPYQAPGRRVTDWVHKPHKPHKQRSDKGKTHKPHKPHKQRSDIGKKREPYGKRSSST